MRAEREWLATELAAMWAEDVNAAYGTGKRRIAAWNRRLKTLARLTCRSPRLLDREVYADAHALAGRASVGG